MARTNFNGKSGSTKSERRSKIAPSQNSKRSSKTSNTINLNMPRKPPVRLPPIKTAKKKSELPPILMRTVYRFQGQAPIVIESTTAEIVEPMIQQTSVENHVPLMKERTFRENLKQKSTIKCKSPRSDMGHSRSTLSMATERAQNSRMRNPLQHMDIPSLLSESARTRLRRLFKKLDTDKDGNLTYNQVEKCLPKNLPSSQVSFFRVTYELLTDGTFFGLNEFYAIAVIIDVIAKQDSILWNLHLDDVDFNYYHDTIVDILEDFTDFCPESMGTIDYSKLIRLIHQRVPANRVEKFALQLQNYVPTIKIMKINRLDFITLIPVLIFLETTSFPHRELFRFRDHSLLDGHLTGGFTS